MKNGVAAANDQIPGLFTPPVRRQRGLGAQEITRFQVTTDTDPLGMRSGPDYTTARVGQSERGSVVVLIGQRDVPGPVPNGTGTWANVRNENGLEGWAAQTGVDVHPTLTELAAGEQPKPMPGPQPTPKPTPTPTPAASTNWTPWIIGGAVLVGGGVLGYAIFVRPKAKHMRHAATAHEEEGHRSLAHAKHLREEAKRAAAREGAAKRKRLRA